MNTFKVLSAISAPIFQFFQNTFHLTAKSSFGQKYERILLNLSFSSEHRQSLLLEIKSELLKNSFKPAKLAKKIKSGYFANPEEAILVLNQDLNCMQVGIKI